MSWKSSSQIYVPVAVAPPLKELTWSRPSVPFTTMRPCVRNALPAGPGDGSTTDAARCSLA